MNTPTTNIDWALHVCRNPYGHNNDSARGARLLLADTVESLRAELAAERAKVAELERDKQLLIESNDHVSIELASAHEKIADLTAQLAANEEDIKHMVNRFLMWKLPKEFHPDAGISFKPSIPDAYDKPGWWPVGTNLFHAEQAKEMIEYMLEGLPSKELSAKESAEPVALPFAILPDELAALQRFHECVMDGEGYDVPKEMMQRLSEIGLLRHLSAQYYEYCMQRIHGLESRIKP